MAYDEHRVQVIIETSNMSLSEENRDEMTSRLNELVKFDKEITSIELIVSKSKRSVSYETTVIVFTPGHKVVSKTEDDELMKAFHHSFDVAKRNVTKNRKKRIGL